MEERLLHIFKAGLANTTRVEPNFVRRRTLRGHQLTGTAIAISVLFPIGTDILSDSRKNCSQVSRWKMKKKLASTLDTVLQTKTL